MKQKNKYYWEAVMIEISYYAIECDYNKTVEKLLNEWLLIYLKRNKKEAIK